MMNKSILKGLVLLFGGVIFFLVSCQAKKPEHVLSQAEMAKALTELYIQEARANRQGISADSVRTVLEYYQSLYAKNNNFPDSAIAVSYEYYLGQPQALSAIYDMVIDTLALREQRDFKSRYNDGAPQ